MSLQKVKINIWNPHPGQKEVATSNARFKILRTGRQWGKTYFCIKTLVKKALLESDSTYFYIAPTYRQAKQIAWKMLTDSVATLPKELVKKVNESELYVDIGNGSRVYLKGADNPDSLRGVTLDGVVLDEFAFMKNYVWEEIIRPALTIKKGFAIFISTPQGYNHFYDLWENASNEDWSRWHFTSYDSPYQSHEELDSIKLEYFRAGKIDYFHQEYLAEFRKVAGAVYPNFDRNVHVIDYQPKNIKEIIVAADFGYHNPAALLKIAVDNDRKFYVLEEYYKTGKTNSELIAWIAAWNPAKVYADPAEPDRIEEMRRAGLNVLDVNKDVSLGISKVKDILGERRLLIHKNCKNLIWELETYHYDTEKNKEEPVKEDDHAADALRYAVFMYEPLKKSLVSRHQVLLTRERHSTNHAR